MKNCMCDERIEQLQEQLDELWLALLRSEVDGLHRELRSGIQRNLATLDRKIGGQVDSARLERVEQTIDRIGQVGKQ